MYKATMYRVCMPEIFHGFILCLRGFERILTLFESKSLVIFLRQFVLHE